MLWQRGRTAVRLTHKQASLELCQRGLASAVRLTHGWASTAVRPTHARAASLLTQRGLASAVRLTHGRAAPVLWQRVPGHTTRWRTAGDGSVSASGSQPQVEEPWGGVAEGKRALEAMLLPRGFPESVRPK